MNRHANIVPFTLLSHNSNVSIKDDRTALLFDFFLEVAILKLLHTTYPARATCVLRDACGASRDGMIQMMASGFLL
jgi:hypothetical protein